MLKTVGVGVLLTTPLLYLISLEIIEIVVEPYLEE